MPKPIIDNNFLQNKTNSTDIKQLSLSQKKLEERSSFKSPELAFREKRPQNYIELIKNLDIEGYTISEEKMKEIVETVQNAIPNLFYDETFLGVLGKCYLGEGYDVHTLSINTILGIDEKTNMIGYGRMILKHYTVHESLPPELEKGRSLAINPNYAFVEIYSDKLIAISENGTASIVKD